MKNIVRNFRLGKKASLKTILLLSEINKGKKNPCYIDGRISWFKQLKNSWQFQHWRKQVLIRDNYTCQECGKEECELHAHHVKTLSFIFKFYHINSLKEALNCKQLFDVSNGLTLCKDCHMKTRTYMELNNGLPQAY
jgi:5-methylcytosine-specific restriction endonuclease McrA